MSDKGILMVISGPTGSGKGQIIKELVKKNKDLYLSVSSTTREKKEGDIEGLSYDFLTRQDFFKKVEQGAFLEWAEIYGNYYGTPKHIIRKKLKEGTNVILELDIKGALQVKEAYEDAVFVFILPSSIEALKARIKESNKIETTESLTRKFNSAYQEITSISKYNYGIVANNIDEAVSKIESIILAEGLRVDRVKDDILLLK